MMRTREVNRLVLFLIVAAIVAIAIGLHVGCSAGWPWRACVPSGLTLFPPAGGGEFLLVESLSLTVCLLGAVYSLLAYVDPQQPGRRVSIVFLLLFLATYIGEHNLFRDDVRAQVLAVLLVWVSIELLILKRILPILLLFTGCMIAFAGSLGDHTMHIQFEHATGKPISQSVLAPVQRVFGDQEEITELLGWTLFVFAALRAFPVRFNPRQTAVIIFLMGLAIIMISTADTFLTLRQTHTFVAARKTGMFVAFAGVMLATAVLYLSFDRSSPAKRLLARAHGATLATAAYMTFVLAPVMSTQEYNKTVSYATWLLPLLALYFYLLKLRPSAVGSVREDSSHESGAAAAIDH